MKTNNNNKVTPIFKTLEKFYIGQVKFNQIKSYADKMGYNLKYKSNIVKKDNISITNYFDLILEKQLRNGKKRHGFIQIRRDRVYLVYKHMIEDITGVISGIKEELVNAHNINKNEIYKVLCEPYMFLEYNIN